MTEFDPQEDKLPAPFAPRMGCAFGEPRFVRVHHDFEVRTGVVLFLRRGDDGHLASSVMACSPYEPANFDTPQWVVDAELSADNAVERAVQQAYHFDEPDIVVKLDDLALWNGAWGYLNEDCRLHKGYDPKDGLGDEIRVVVDDVYEPVEGFVILVDMYHRDLADPESIHQESGYDVVEMLAKAEELALSTKREVIVQLVTSVIWRPEWGTLTLEEETTPPSFRLDIGRTEN